jgi:hypothetical protein
LIDLSTLELTYTSCDAYNSYILLVNGLQNQYDFISFDSSNMALKIYSENQEDVGTY